MPRCKQSVVAVGKVLNISQRTQMVRAALTGPNGTALLDFLMAEYIFDELVTDDPYKQAKHAGQRELVLRLRRLATEQ